METEDRDREQHTNFGAYPQDTGREGGAEPLQEPRGEEDSDTMAEHPPEEAEVRERGDRRTRVRRRVRIEEEYDEESGPR